MSKALIEKHKEEIVVHLPAADAQLLKELIERELRVAEVQLEKSYEKRLDRLFDAFAVCV